MVEVSTNRHTGQSSKCGGLKGVDSSGGDIRWKPGNRLCDSTLFSHLHCTTSHQFPTISPVTTADRNIQERFSISTRRTLVSALSCAFWFFLSLLGSSFTLINISDSTNWHTLILVCNHGIDIPLLLPSSSSSLPPIFHRYIRSRGLSTVYTEIH